MEDNAALCDILVSLRVTIVHLCLSFFALAEIKMSLSMTSHL